MDTQTLKHEQAQIAATVLKTIANANRLLILCHLSEGEKKVGELEKLIGISQSALSQHLARLRENGIVSFRKEAQSAYYYIADERVLSVMKPLAEGYCQNAAI